MSNIEPVQVLSAIEAEKPKLNSFTDAVVVALHYLMILEEFRFQGEGVSENKLPEKWNQSSDVYTFRYKHSRSSMTFSLKCLVLEDKLLVHAVAVENTKNIFDLELSIDEYINKNINLTDYEKLYKNLDKLVTLFKVNISRKLVPEINKPGYEESMSNTASSTTNSNRNNDGQDDNYDPLRIGPIRQPPQYDPLRVGGPSRYGPPFGIGTGDRFPSITPPLPGMGGFGGDNGNWMGPNHPAFGIVDPFAPNTGFGGPPLPRGSVPPGARFDPYGPPAPFRGGGSSQGRGNRGFEPNPDHERIPSEYDDMFS